MNDIDSQLFVFTFDTDADLLRRELDARFIASQDRSIAMPPPPYMQTDVQAAAAVAAAAAAASGSAVRGGAPGAPQHPSTAVNGPPGAGLPAGLQGLHPGTAPFLQTAGTTLFDPAKFPGAGKMDPQLAASLKFGPGAPVGYPPIPGMPPLGALGPLGLGPPPVSAPPCAVPTSFANPAAVAAGQSAPITSSSKVGIGDRFITEYNDLLLLDFMIF